MEGEEARTKVPTAAGGRCARTGPLRSHECRGSAHSTATWVRHWGKRRDYGKDAIMVEGGEGIVEAEQVGKGRNHGRAWKRRNYRREGTIKGE